MNLKLKKERREEVLASQKLSNGGVLSLGAPQGLEPKEFAPQGLSLTPKKAFSIAEAMIVFTIVSVAIASVAPMISKQVKYNEMSDLQAKVLNQRIEEVKKSAWKLTPDKKSITRPDDNVGIGVSAGTNPSAKLEVKNDDSSLVGLKLSNPSQFNSNILDVNKGNQLVFDITGYGMTQARNGLEIFYPDQSDGGINYLTTWKSNEERTGDSSQDFRHVLARDGGIHTRARGDYAMVLKDDEGNNLLVSHSDGAFRAGYRKIGTNENYPRFHISKYGAVSITASTREEVYPDDPDNDRRNDVRALSIRYPEDSSADLDCAEYDSVGNCISPRTDDGYTETAFFNSVGSLYINSLIHGFHNEAIAVRNGSVYRAWIRTDGQVNIAVSDAAPDGKALIIKEPMARNFEENAWIRRDGSAWFKGNVTVDGTIANAELDTKFAKVNDELVSSKEMIVQLKNENSLLKEKLSMFESQLEQILAQQNLEKVAQKRKSLFVK